MELHVKTFNKESIVVIKKKYILNSIDIKKYNLHIFSPLGCKNTSSNYSRLKTLLYFVSSDLHTIKNVYGEIAQRCH